MKEFIKLSITESFKEKALKTDFSKLNKSYPNPMCNVNQTKWYALNCSKICALFYYETGINIDAFGGNESQELFYGYYA